MNGLKAKIKWKSIAEFFLAEVDKCRWKIVSFDYTAQKMKFSIIYLLKKSLMENFMFCAVLFLSVQHFVNVLRFYVVIFQQYVMLTL